MEEVVVDASVITKWYVVEEFREEALRLRDDYIEGKFRLSAPSVMPFEVLNAIRCARKDVDVKVLSEIAGGLALYGIDLHGLHGEYAKRTVETTLENGITVYDASYVALAEHLNTTMYTADQKLIDKLKNGYRRYVKHLKDYT